MAKETNATLDRTTPKRREPRGAGQSGGTHVDGTHVDVVGIVTSAGGLEAISTVLRALPTDFSAAIVVAQHLGGQGSLLVSILERRIALPVDWARDGEPVRAGHVTVCPSRSILEVLPDRTCAVRKLESIKDRPLDLLLTSLAHSFGAGALGVVLTGMGSDGANGAAAVKRAGGTMIAQSEDTAEQPSMPRAAINAGVDLVLPLHEIGKVIREVVSGARLPRPRSEIEAAEALFAGPGEARAELRRIDWSATPLGPVTGWSPALRTIVRAVLDNDFPMFVMWGPDLVQIGNDAYAPTLGNKRMQGLPVRTTWAEIWDFVRPQFEQIRLTGQPIFAKDVQFSPNRRGFVEEAYFTYCYSPLHDEGQFAGILETSLETTSRVLAERRLATLRALGAAGGGVKSTTLACERAVRTLAENPKDIPFALIYLHDPLHGSANLCAWTGVEAGSLVAPRTFDVRNGHVVWPLGRVLTQGAQLVVEELPARFSAFHAGPWPEPPSAAMLLPLRPLADEPPVGVLVAGFSARLAVDEAYRGFFDLVAKQVSASLAESRTRQRERERLERLAELDRVKTEFFSNVSHEFRTPLTLILGPLEELLRRRGDLPAPAIADLEVAARNSRRLLALVNTLLDFSQIEAGRLRAHFEPTDLADLTTDIASVFRSAVERAGLRFVVECPELPERVWVDRAMWEKIVSNLLSNAIKFTFDGEIEVRLRALPKHVELVVRDTGVGIPVEEQSQIFKRFHRVRASHARTHEGTGIGLALVHELVRLHHGRVRVQSEPGKGSTFTVWIPLGKRAVDEAVQESAPASPSVAETLAEEATAWAAPAAGHTPDGVLSDALGVPKHVEAIAHGVGASILVAEDNADMRDYLHRLLSPYWRVELAVDGQDALERARLKRPDLVLADVMMPRLDGFGLLSALRADETLRRTSVILLTARAGEEAAIQGLLAGADDYIAKPFSARELIARIGGQIELSRLRRRTAELNEFLVRFSDAVRGLADPVEVARTACRMIHEQLGVERAYWAEVDWATRDYVIMGECHSPGVSVIEGRFPLDAWEPFTSLHLEGRSIVVDDTQADPRLPAPVKDGYAQIAVGADLATPVVVDGKLRCTFAVNQRLPRRWTPEEIALVESVAVRCWGEVERARAEQALRASEERQAFLLKLSDALRPLTDAVEIQGTAARVLGEHLGVTRAMYADVEGEPGDEVGTLRGQYHAPGAPAPAGETLPPFPERYRYDAYGERVMALRRRGETMVVTDVTTDSRFDAGVRAAWIAGSVRAAVTVALVKAGRFVGDFGVQSAAPREWTADEVALVEETAERTWAALQRARAEAALHDSEERYRTLFETMDEGYVLAEVLYDAAGRPVDALYLEGNPAASRLTGVPDYSRRLWSEVAAGAEPYWLEIYDRVARTGVAERLERYAAPLARWYDFYVSRAAGAHGGARRIAVVFQDITERKRAETTLRESQERQAFLLKLSDALRPLADASEIKAAASRILGEQLHVNRAFYAEVDGEDWLVVNPYEQDVEHQAEGRHPIAGFGQWIADMFRAGQRLVIRDLHADGRFDPSQRAAHEAYRILGAVAVPLVKEGRLVAILAVHSATPRDWQEREIALVEETAERTWAAVERARAEAALRASEEQYRTLFESAE